jgi:hypothetical protein
MMVSLWLFSLLGGCSEYEYIRSEGVDVWYQDPLESVDILMVVDDSCSMQPYQERLGQNFEAFINYFIDANVNYHIAVVTTDIESAGAGEFVGQIITPETKNAAAKFNSFVNVGIEGSSFEMGLEAAKLALSPALLSSTNTDFLREEAGLSIIFTSDEEDASPEPVNHYINNFFEVKGQRDRDVFNASTLTALMVDNCPGGSGGASVTGTRYIDVAEQTNGIVGDICADEEDFSTIVNELSLNASRLRADFTLSSLPATATLTLAIDEEFIECTTGDWRYELAVVDGVSVAKVIFSESAIPPVTSRIEVRYDYGDGDPANFCVSAASTTDEVSS